MICEGTLNEQSQDQRRRSSGAIAFAGLPCVALPCDGPRMLQQISPSAQKTFAGDPADLVARALAILAEEAEAGRIRENPAARSMP